jgi:two-component sensor histidine kinase/frataxin-like iron-binding protein CyaY
MTIIGYGWHKMKILKKKYLYKIDKTSGKIEATYPFPNCNNNETGTFVNNFYVDNNKVVWMATKLGLYSFNKDKNEWKNWRNLPNDKTSISNDKILSICPDPKEPAKYLWLGTEGSGFSKFEIATGKCVHFSGKDGLPNDVCYGILSDSLGSLWISTNNGLSCFIPYSQSLSKGGGRFRNFTEDDGIMGNEFNRWQFMKLANGNLMFGGVEGITMFNPIGILEKQKPVPLIFTGLSISNKTIHFKTDSTVINAPIEYAKTISLPVDKNNFTISFASLEYRSNQNKYYTYKLVGLDNNFTEPSNRNEAVYTNLSPGTYTLVVKGTNTDGVWSDKEISIEIVVPPHWYQTWWFFSLVGLLVLFILFQFNQYKIGQAIKLEKLRNRIAIDLHDEIGSTLSSIALFSEAAKKMNTNDSADKVLNKINTSTTEMMEAMSDIVWAVNNKNDKLENVMNRMRDFAVQICEPKEINLHFTDNKNIANVELDMVQRKNTYLIFKEAINNAVKYSHCKNIWVEVDCSKNSFQLSIKDDGKGFNTNETTVDNKFGGNGLKNMQQRANEINATISINTKINLGTLVDLKMPL